MNYKMEIYQSNTPLNCNSFIKKWHYSASVARGTTHVFALYHKTLQKFGEPKLIGVAQYGIPTGRNCQNAYTIFGGKVLELKRFCLIDDTPKNTESWFISKTLRWFKSHTKIEAVLSYADKEYGHEGIIYQASNFNYIGETCNYNTKAVFFAGQKYHIRQAYQKGTKTSDILLKALESGLAQIIKLKPKNIYIYRFKRSTGVFYNQNRNEIYTNYKPENESHIFLGKL